MLFQRIATAPPGARGSSGAPRLAEGARILSGPDLPVQAEAADRPHDAPSIDEEVRRRGRHPGEAPAFSRAKALLRDASPIEGIWRRARAGLDRTREHSIDHGIRQGDECQEGRYGAAAQGDVAVTASGSCHSESSTSGYRRSDWRALRHFPYPR